MSTAAMHDVHVAAGKARLYATLKRVVHAMRGSHPNIALLATGFNYVAVDDDMGSGGEEKAAAAGS
jgi:hypothetical protein